MAKTLMILGGSILQLPAIKKARELGLNVVVVDMNPNAIGFDEPGVIKEVISTIDIPLVTEAAKRHHIDGIMTLASDMPMRTVAYVSKELGLIGIDEATALKATNKYEMRKALDEYGVPIPMFFKASSKEEFLKNIKSFKGKFIVKPADNSGSRGIYLVDDISKADEAYEYSKSNSRNGDVVIEEYMEGPEVSVETLTIDGVCHVIQITDKLTTGAPHFVEMGHSQPSQLEDCIKEKIRNVAKAANRAVGIKNGPSHTEIIVTKQGPKIVELGARLGGDCITTHLVPLSTGVDMVECCIKIALGENPSVEKTLSKGSAIRYIKQKAGVIKNISGSEDVLALNGIKSLSFVYNVGDRVDEVTNSASRLGFVIAQGKDAIDAIDICESALSYLNIQIGD